MSTTPPHPAEVVQLTLSATALLEARASPATSCEVRCPGIASVAVAGDMLQLGGGARFSCGRALHCSTAALDQCTRGFDTSITCYLHKSCRLSQLFLFLELSFPTGRRLITDSKSNGAFSDSARLNKPFHLGIEGGPGPGLMIGVCITV